MEIALTEIVHLMAPSSAQLIRQIREVRLYVLMLLHSAGHIAVAIGRCEETYWSRFIPFQSDRRRISLSIPAICAWADFIPWWSLDSRRRCVLVAPFAAAFLRCSSWESLAL